MKSMKLVRSLGCLLAIWFVAGCGQQQQPQAEATDNRAREIINETRLKRLTSGLELTAEQQAQVKALLAEEGKEVDKIHATAATAGDAQARQLIDLRQATYEKMKPLLTPAQLEKFDSVIAKVEGRKKK